MCNTSPLARNNSGCLRLTSVPTLLIMQRTYLMCPPEYFSVTYSINAWMDTAVPVDTELAVKQWERPRADSIALHANSDGESVRDVVQQLLHSSRAKLRASDV